MEIYAGGKGNPEREQHEAEWVAWPTSSSDYKTARLSYSFFLENWNFILL